jgi:hypothetical protein
MRSIKAGSSLVEFIKLCYAAGSAPLLVGKHGVGKSQLLERAAEEMGIGCIVRDLSLMEPPDLVGMPKLDGDTTRFLPPAWLPTEDKGGKGLLIFEELNRCPFYMRAPCLQLLTARTLNDYTLPRGWLPCAAVNPSGGDYDVQELDPALVSRFVVVNVVADPKSWCEWAETAGVHSDVINYVASDAHVFEFSNPRAWAGVSGLLHAEQEGGFSVPILDGAIAGRIGNELAVAFKQFRKHGFATPDAYALLTEYDKYRSRIRDWVEQGKTDLLNDVVFKIMVHFQDPSNFEMVYENMEMLADLERLLRDLPPDLADKIIVDLQGRDYDVPVSLKAATHTPPVFKGKGKKKTP